MNVLFTSAAILNECNGQYHSNNLFDQLKRYSYFGDITCVCYRRVVPVSKMTLLEKESAKFVFVQKENSILNKFKSRKNNELIIKEQVSKCDMLIAHVPCEISYHAIKWAKKQNKPYFVVVVGCAWDAHWNYDWRGKLLAPFSYFQLKRVVAQAKYALYVTEFFLQNRYPCKGVVEHASNVCIEGTPRTLLDSRLERISKYSKHSKINIVTTAGVHVRYKGQEYVIRAISKLKNNDNYDFHYYLIGTGSQTYLSKIAEENNVLEKVHFLGGLSHSDVIRTLDEMDIYIQPSKQEGLPRALIEGMSRCLPSIGSNVAGIPELLSTEFLVKKGSVQDIVKVITNHTSVGSLKNQAKNNYEKSLAYTKDKLDARRKLFFDKFIQEYNLSIK